MFFDYVGHDLKDLMILFLVAFTFVLSAVLLNVNNRVGWWTTQCSSNCDPKDGDVRDYDRLGWADWMAGVFIAITSLFVVYAIYTNFVKPSLKNF
jgi:hypothetical protein